MRLALAGEPHLVHWARWYVQTPAVEPGDVIFTTFPEALTPQTFRAAPADLPAYAERLILFYETFHPAYNDLIQRFAMQERTMFFFDVATRQRTEWDPSGGAWRPYTSVRAIR